jgi:hypothetical protein
MNPPFIRRALRWLGWTVLGIVAVLAAAIVYYRFDEPLSAEAQAVLAASLPLGEISERNGYVAMLGMSAPPGEDQMAWGRKVAAGLLAQDAPGFKADGEWLHLTKNHAGFPKRAAWCNPGKDCVAEFKAREAELSRIVDEQRELLARYRAMRARPVYEESYAPQRFESILPNYGALGTGHVLTRFLIFRAAARGDAAAALREMEQEIAFHWRVIAGSRTLIGKMVALRQLANDALVLSDLMSAYRGAMAPHAARIGRMLAADESRLDVLPLLAFELRGAAQLLNDPAALTRGAEDWWWSLFYRPRMTVNAMVAGERAKLAALATPASGFDQAGARVREIDERLRRPGWLDYARNPAGSAVLAIGGFFPAEYVGRSHDTAALLRLVRAQAALLEARAQKPEEILKVLFADGGRRFVDPYTGKPFAVDAASRSVSFQARVKGGWQASAARADHRIAIVP